MTELIVDEYGRGYVVSINRRRTKVRVAVYKQVFRFEGHLFSTALGLFAELVAARMSVIAGAEQLQPRPAAIAGLKACLGQGYTPDQIRHVIRDARSWASCLLRISGQPGRQGTRWLSTADAH